MVNDKDSLFPEKEHYWKNEVVSRLQQHRARRQKNSDQDPLELDFPDLEARQAPRNQTAPAGESRSVKRSRRTASDEFERQSLHASTARSEQAGTLAQLKIIRFPAVLPERERLAEHMPFEAVEETETPRVLEAEADEIGGREEWPNSSPRRTRTAFVAEQMQLLPSFEDIQLEDSGYQISGDMELVPRPAPLRLRAFAAAIDAGVVLAGALVFGITFD
ncbi:MAG: hypothetical protein ACRD4F_12400, partial [Candidatus Angelobacter sp.]